MSDVMETPRTRGRKKEDRPWSEEEESRLRKMRREGVGFKECAKKLGRTREGCIGKMDRLSGRNAARSVGAPAPERRPISLGGPPWSRPERFQS
jgi:hypothetical protein